MSDVIIRVQAKGPYQVTGPCEIYDASGEAIAIPLGKTVYLCRCGGSLKKPFCDGTHSRIGFMGAETAVAKANEDPAKK